MARNTISPICEGIYWVHNNGNLIAKSGRSKKTDDIVMSMLTAMTSFTQDVLKRQLKVVGEMPRKMIIEHGYATIHIHKAQYSFMMSIIVGDIPRNHMGNIQKVQESLERTYVGLLPEWDGSYDQINLTTVRKEMRKLDPS